MLHPVNKFGHFWSSVFMILFAYPSIFLQEGKKLQGCAWFFITHVVRQTGHFFYEHQDRDIEKVSSQVSLCCTVDIVGNPTCMFKMFTLRTTHEVLLVLNPSLSLPTRNHSYKAQVWSQRCKQKRGSRLPFICFRCIYLP